MSNQEKIRNYLNQKSLTYEQHLKEIRNVSIKDAHLYCLLANVSSNTVGRLLDARIGKGVSSRVSIYVSLKSAFPKKQFHYTQVKICDEIEVYLMTAYDLSENNAENGGELYVFRLGKDAMIDLLRRYATRDNSLHPVFGGECWNALMSFRVSEEDVRTLF